jgi:hypothetical protein
MPAFTDGSAQRHMHGTQMKTRDTRIDIIRGIAMLTILLNHISFALAGTHGYTGLTIPTLTYFGYSSAASLFVGMSGYMVGMAYLKRPNPTAAILRRARQLYLINLGLLGLLVAFAYIFPAHYDDFWHIKPFVQPPYVALLKFLALLDAPGFQDIFHLYVALMLVTPLAILLFRRSPLLLAACSIGVWGIMQIAGVIWSPDGVLLSNGHSLNVLAWQMTFFLPMIAGTMKLHQRMFDWLEGHPRAIVGLWVALLVAGIAYKLHAHAILPLNYQLTNRVLNSPIWVMHSLLVFGGYAGLLTWLAPHLQHWAFQLLASMGRNSLNVFAASIPLTYLIVVALHWLALGTLGYLLGVVALVGLSLGVAAWGDRKKRRKANGPTTLLPAEPLPAGPASSAEA